MSKRYGDRLSAHLEREHLLLLEAGQVRDEAAHDVAVRHHQHVLALAQPRLDHIHVVLARAPRRVLPNKKRAKI